MGSPVLLTCRRRLAPLDDDDSAVDPDDDAFDRACPHPNVITRSA